jgi:hypothetical protein
MSREVVVDFFAFFCHETAPKHLGIASVHDTSENQEGADFGKRPLIEANLHDVVGYRGAMPSQR